MTSNSSVLETLPGIVQLISRHEDSVPQNSLCVNCGSMDQSGSELALNLISPYWVLTFLMIARWS